MCNYHMLAAQLFTMEFDVLIILQEQCSLGMTQHFPCTVLKQYHWNSTHITDTQHIVLAFWELNSKGFMKQRQLENLEIFFSDPLKFMGGLGTLVLFQPILLLIFFVSQCYDQSSLADSLPTYQGFNFYTS